MIPKGGKMPQEITLKVNDLDHHLYVEPDTPLLYVLRNDLGLKGPKFGCGLEQCGACKVIIDGQAVPSCHIPVGQVQGLAITTVEGLGTADDLHPLQEAFMIEQAIQCGYCVTGMIMAAQGLLNQRRYPTDEEIRSALADNLCRCGVYDRVRRAIKLRVGYPVATPIYEVSHRELQPESAPPDQTKTLPGSLLQTPDLDAWIRINSDRTVTLFSGKVEYGQGLKTALAQIGAEELDLSLEQIRVVMADTAQTPNEFMTTGSMSLETSGNAIRYAAAEARHILLLLASEELEAPIERLQVSEGVITDPASGRSATYWDLFSGQKFATQVTGVAQPKHPETYKLVGQPATRLDLLPKVTGEPYFIHDLDLPDMVHGRVVRPPSYGAKLVAVDVEAVAQMPGVLKVVRDGSFLAVIAEREDQAIKAMQRLREEAVWEGGPNLPPQEALFDHLLTQPDQAFLVVNGAPVTDPIPPIETAAKAAHTLAATYCRPYHMHASLGPAAAAAHMVDGKLTVWTQAQGVFPPRASIAHVLGMSEEDIRVIHREGSGCYGHNGADDAALDAALLARALPGRPVLLKWMRADEHGWEPYGPAMVVKMQASLNDQGQIIAWNHDVWSYPHLGRPRVDGETSGLLAAWYLSEPFPRPQPRLAMAPHVGGHRNADALYAFPKRRIVTHFVPNSPLRTSSQRGLGAYGNVFAIESFMDELAHTIGAAPVEFRLRHLEDGRARAVIEAAAEKAGWQAGQRLQGEGRGRGIAFARYKNRQCYAAVVVELRVDRASGQIQLERVVIAADAGQIINPDGLSNQLEGGVYQAASWTLKERVTFDQNGVTSLDWESYPILSFAEAPVIETILLNRPDQPHVGSGEATQGPTPAAIANAVFDAVGVRLREIPFTPERVRAALNSLSWITS
jgi:CO/xanthine dehydrogenase Mo-binding subunit/aerobic-type carbon monoxide dehydrogenase small subunit (CoxS/CutS family)